MLNDMFDTSCRQLCRDYEAALELKVLESFNVDSDKEEICGDCGLIASVEDDGCCKWRMMNYYR